MSIVRIVNIYLESDQVLLTWIVMIWVSYLQD